MPSNSTSTAERDDRSRETDSSTLLNACIGAVAGVVLSFIPLSPLLGGAVAGYLEGGDTNDGLRIGTYAGVIMLVPFLVMALLGITFLLSFGTGGPTRAFGLFGIVILLLGTLYTVGLSALGGYLGIYINDEF